MDRLRLSVRLLAPATLAVALALPLAAAAAKPQVQSLSTTAADSMDAPKTAETAQASMSLTTLFSANNCQDGNMFDVKATKGIVIRGFDINTDFSGTVDVYYKAGSWVGYETNPGAWTLLGSATVTGNGVNAATPLPIGGLTIPAGQTYGLYITAEGDGGCNLHYTNGTTDYSNSDLTIYHGAGKQYPFAETFTPRIWNGTIYYTLAFDFSFLDDYGRSQFCVNSQTGDYLWTVLTGPQAGSQYSGTAKVFNGGAQYSSLPGAPDYLKLTYDPVRKKAYGYLIDSARHYYPLSDANTADDPPCGGVS